MSKNKKQRELDNEQHRKIFGRDKPEVKKSCCCGCEQDSEQPAVDVDKVREAIKKEEEYQKYVSKNYQNRNTKRRTIVEEIKTTSETVDGRVGESDTVVVEYEYGRDESRRDFVEVEIPSRVKIGGGQSNYHPFSDSTRYTALQLKAHIKNLQTILETIE